ncbi:hypothetical protein [Bacterioplanoides sp.]|uniref:hypothetical protein n=1 Tax=Bacterioplanoides sp. TaxID=2066072 RepID=UPI003B5C2BCB
MKKITQRLNKTMAKAGFVAAGAALSAQSFAINDEDITGAFAAGETSYGLAIAGIIGLAAIGVGVGFVMGMLRKS